MVSGSCFKSSPTLPKHFHVEPAMMAHYVPHQMALQPCPDFQSQTQARSRTSIAHTIRTKRKKKDQGSQASDVFAANAPSPVRPHPKNPQTGKERKKSSQWQGWMTTSIAVGMGSGDTACFRIPSLPMRKKRDVPGLSCRTVM